LSARAVTGRTIAVCGILADKDIDGIAAELHGSFDAWVAVGLSGPRALEPHVLADRLLRAGAPEVSTARDVQAGCQAAESSARPGDRIVVFGSFLTVAPALALLQ
jgi:dihydrofolate synthase/folylpolyglutamate synthase